MTFLMALGASLLAAVVTTLGIFTIRHFSAWGQRNAAYFMWFAAGVLIAASFLHVIPESLEMSPHASAWLLAGFLGLHLVKGGLQTIPWTAAPGQRDYLIGIVPMLGIGFHSFVDGFIYSVTFTVGTRTGMLASVGMILHEFPEGIITYLLLLRGGFARRTCTLLALLAAAATTPLGVLASYPLIADIDPCTLGALLALSAGALVYVGAAHLLPRAEQEQRSFSLLALAGGVLVAVLITLVGA
ncbi:MAG: ZIP family metal transporter [Pseudomonadales bacterium]